jgi:hypothetical protein
VGRDVARFGDDGERVVTALHFEHRRNRERRPVGSVPLAGLAVDPDGYHRDGFVGVDGDLHGRIALRQRLVAVADGRPVDGDGDGRSPGGTVRDGGVTADATQETRDEGDRQHEPE